MNKINQVHLQADETKSIISKLIKDLVTTVTSTNNHKVEPHTIQRVICNPTSQRSVNQPIMAEIIGTNYIAMNEVHDITINGKVNSKKGPDLPFSLFFNITWEDKSQSISKLGVYAGNNKYQTIEISDSASVLSDAVFCMELESKFDNEAEGSRGHCRGVLLFDKKSP